MQVQLIPSQQLEAAKPAWKILWCAPHHHFPSSLSLLRTWGISKMWTLHSEEAFGRAAINLLGSQGSESQEGGQGREKKKVSTLKSCLYIETSSRPLFKVLLGYFNYKHVGFFLPSLTRWKDNFNIRRKYIKGCHFDAKCFKWIEFFLSARHLVCRHQKERGGNQLSAPENGAFCPQHKADPSSTLLTCSPFMNLQNNAKEHHPMVM